MNSRSLKLIASSRKIIGNIPLTGSKSESNRALIIRELSKGLVEVENLSEAADTVSLTTLLGNQQADTYNVGPAGTAMRFLTAFLCFQDGTKILTGSERMKKRPIALLVDALREVGAEISYLEAEGYPPLQITGPLNQTGTKISIPGNISSQYISALLLIAPRLRNGLTLEIKTELTSKPYVEMTLAMLQESGIHAEWDEYTISIEAQPFKKATLSIEPDWSAASYWYAVAMLASESSIFLPGLKPYSLQGDSSITEIMANFGISSEFKDGGVWIKKEAKTPFKDFFDLKECPDLAQTIIVCCAAIGFNATFTGLETLKIKETDRIAALQNELAKIGVQLIAEGLNYRLDCSGLDLSKEIEIETYEDHRMAMAFAPLALVLPSIIIQDYDVVAKSYPNFWNHMEKLGINSTEIDVEAQS